MVVFYGDGNVKKIAATEKNVFLSFTNEQHKDESKEVS
jgi:hypothetical protein